MTSSKPGVSIFPQQLLVDNLSTMPKTNLHIISVAHICLLHTVVVLSYMFMVAISKVEPPLLSMLQCQPIMVVITQE